MAINVDSSSTYTVTHMKTVRLGTYELAVIRSNMARSHKCGALAKLLEISVRDAMQIIDEETSRLVPLDVRKC